MKTVIPVVAVVFCVGVVGAVETGKAVPPPPNKTWDYQPVKAKKVKRHVIKIVKVDPDFCIPYFGEKPKKRFIRRTSNLLVVQNNWGPHHQVRKGVRQGFKKACDWSE